MFKLAKGFIKRRNFEDCASFLDACQDEELWWVFKSQEVGYFETSVQLINILVEFGWSEEEIMQEILSKRKEKYILVQNEDGYDIYEVNLKFRN